MRSAVGGFNRQRAQPALRAFVNVVKPVPKFYRIIQSLAHTIKADVGLINLFDQFRKKRNISGYDHAGMVSEQEAHEMVNLAGRLRQNVEEWICKNHPDLME